MLNESRAKAFFFKRRVCECFCAHTRSKRTINVWGPLVEAQERLALITLWPVLVAPLPRLSH